ncbi:MAG: tail fiber domain-containing protein [Aequorivita antarctica]
MKYVLFLHVLLFTISSFSQVGIGTANPSAQLDIRSSSQTAPSNIDGILIPKINNFPGTPPTAAQDGMVVYATGSGSPSKGFYYWDNNSTSWKAVGSKKTDDLSDGKSDSNGSSIFMGIDSGLMDDGTNNRNVGMGFNSLYSNVDGSRNTAAGFNTLYSNTSGTNNTAFGYSALKNSTDSNSNTAIGSGSLLTNTTGDYNTATGTFALNSNTLGSFNTASGFQSLFSNTDGQFNTALGNDALYSNTGGDYNTAIGKETLYNLSGGDNNTAVGVRALYNHTNGVNNTAIGFNAQVPNSIGSNQVRFGNSDVSLAEIQVAWNITSDKRWKNQIRPLPYGLNMVSQLKPVDYIRKNNENGTREIGFIAQDVQALLEKLGYTDQGILSTDDNGFMSLRYNDFIPVLVKAVQEQQKLIEDLQKERDAFEEDYTQNNEKTNELENRLKKLETLLLNKTISKD